MALSKKGVSRQDAHEEVRLISHQAGTVVKMEGKPNDLIVRIRHTPFFAPILDQLDQLLDPKTFTGRAPEQVEKFTAPGGEVDQALERYRAALQKTSVAELHV